MSRFFFIRFFADPRTIKSYHYPWGSINPSCKATNY